jgi:hypothetical protein
MKLNTEISQKEALELFEYNSFSGALCWKKTLDNRAPKGKQAGYINNGYIRIGINRKSYAAHRIIWLIIKGEWPKKQIDHIDGNRSNNKWGNLREATPYENLWNSKKHKNNSSQYKGVYYHKRSHKWIARIRVHPKRIWIGSFSSALLASKAYEKEEKKYHKSFVPIRRPEYDRHQIRIHKSQSRF